jgi:hypothetical protein
MNILVAFLETIIWLKNLLNIAAVAMPITDHVKIVKLS